MGDSGTGDSGSCRVSNNVVVRRSMLNDRFSTHFQPNQKPR